MRFELSLVQTRGRSEIPEAICDVTRIPVVVFLVFVPSLALFCVRALEEVLVHPALLRLLGLAAQAVLLVVSGLGLGYRVRIGLVLDLRDVLVFQILIESILYLTDSAPN